MTKTRIGVVIVLAACGAAAGALAQAQDRPEETALRAIEMQGRRIASYHEAIARAKEKYAADDSEDAAGVKAVVVDRSPNFKVIFLRLNKVEEVAKGWLMVAEAGFNPKAGEVTAMQVYNPPKTAPNDALIVQRAIQNARTAAEQRTKEGRPPFDEAVLKNDDRTFTVFLTSRTPDAATVRFGGDFEAQMSGDGNQAMRVAGLHGTAAATVPIPAHTGGDATLHTHIVGDLPTATDVALLIEHPKLAPHIVMTPRYMFRLDAGGGITYLGPNPVPPAAAPGGRR